MKKLALVCLIAGARRTGRTGTEFIQPVKWKNTTGRLQNCREKEIVFTATAEKGWHLYDQDLPEGGPVSTSFTFETLKGAELIGKPVSSVNRPPYTTNCSP